MIDPRPPDCFNTNFTVHVSAKLTFVSLRSIIVFKRLIFSVYSMWQCHDQRKREFTTLVLSTLNSTYVPTDDQQEFLYKSCEVEYHPIQVIALCPYSLIQHLLSQGEPRIEGSIRAG